MANDTDNNFLVSGASGEALIATDYSASENSHFQVMKVAFGTTSENPTRVSSTTGLPVEIKNPSVAISGNVGLLTGTSVLLGSGITLLGGTASFNIIRISATGQNAQSGFTGGGWYSGQYDSSGTTGFHSIRVVGLSGAWPVAVTGNQFDIRRISGGTLTAGGSFDGSQDTIRVIGFSGAYPVETLMFGLSGISDKTSRSPVRVDGLGNLFVNVNTGVTGITVSALTPFTDVSGSTSPLIGFQTRILRASTGGIPLDTVAEMQTYLNALPSMEDTVRVTGLSGGYPVSTLLFGLSGSDIKSLKTDTDGNLKVSVAVGSIAVTASVGGVTLGGAVIVSGLSFNSIGNGLTLYPTVWTGLTNFGIANGLTALGPTGYSQVIQIQGWKYGWTGGGTGFGVNPIPITTEITGPVLIYGTYGGGVGAGLVGVTGVMGVTGTVTVVSTSSLLGITHPTLPLLGACISSNKLQVTDPTNIAASVNTAITGLCGAVASLQGVFGSTSVVSTLPSQSIKVSVIDVVQPTGITTGRVSTALAGAQLGSQELESGINLKSDLRNTSQTIYIGTDATNVANKIGYPLYNGDQIFIETSNTNKIFYASDVAGATLHFIGT